MDIHGGPAVGFDEPFEMLAACHQRVERMLALLERLAAHLATSGCDSQACAAAASILRYFDQAGPAHHEDEERHLFPVLAASDDPALRELVARLRAEHREMGERWAALRTELVAIANREYPADARADSGNPCFARWAAFAALYRAHIVAEEGIAYPAAEPLFDHAARAAIGIEMAARRGARAPGSMGR